MDNERLNIYTYKTYHYTIIVRISYEFLLSGFEFVLGRWLPFFAETGSNHENVARHAKCPEWWVFMFSFCSQCFPPFRLHDQCFLVQKKRPNHCPIHCADVVPQAEEHWELRLEWVQCWVSQFRFLTQVEYFLHYPLLSACARPVLEPSSRDLNRLLQQCGAKFWSGLDFFSDWTFLTDWILVCTLRQGRLAYGRNGAPSLDLLAWWMLKRSHRLCLSSSQCLATICQMLGLWTW